MDALKNLATSTPSKVGGAQSHEIPELGLDPRFKVPDSRKIVERYG
jgi:hypothetical protein